MPLTYPLAETARAALEAAATARTVGEARDKAGAAVSLVSEWLRPSASERQTLQEQIDAGVAAGFIQVYEDNQAQPVFAVAFWKRGAAISAPPLRHKPAPEASAQPPVTGDTVDDLYFERGRTSRRTGRGRRPRAGDPNQMDLFTGPDPKGFASPHAGEIKAEIGDADPQGPASGMQPGLGAPAGAAGQGGPSKSPKAKSPKAGAARKPKPGAKP